MLKNPAKKVKEALRVGMNTRIAQVKLMILAVKVIAVIPAAIMPPKTVRKINNLMKTDF